MKKSILFFCVVIIALCLTAFEYKNLGISLKGEEKPACGKKLLSIYNPVNTNIKRTDIPFFYNVDHRFMTATTKEKLIKAKSIIDILPEKATHSKVSYQNVKIVILRTEEKVIDMGESIVFNDVQKKLIQSLDYSANFYISASCKSKNDNSGELKSDTLIYYLTLVPEKEAEYTGGKDALIEYLKENSKEATANIQKGQLQPGTIHFTVTTKGVIGKVNLTSTSGYTSIDKKMVELITLMPENWNPATNSKGDKVDQELVFFFGLQGC